MDVILPIFSQRLKQLTDDLVEASKITSGNISLQMERLDFKELVKQTCGELLGKTERHYQAIEAGCINVPATQLIFLAGYFQTSVDSLLGLSDQR